MNYNSGDKLLCKKDYNCDIDGYTVSYAKGNYYKIIEVGKGHISFEHNVGRKIPYDNWAFVTDNEYDLNHYTLSYLDSYFYTRLEERKLKLERLK